MRKILGWGFIQISNS